MAAYGLLPVKPRPVHGGIAGDAIPWLSNCKSKILVKFTKDISPVCLAKRINTFNRIATRFGYRMRAASNRRRGQHYAHAVIDKHIDASPCLQAEYDLRAIKPYLQLALTENPE